MTLCECGCGREAPIAEKSYKRYGVIKGESRRFISGHHRRKSFDTYSMRGSAGERGYLHRIRAQRALGKALPPKAVVHHADGSRSDDAPLVICQDQAYHRLLHARMRIQAAGGDPNNDKFCTTCKRLMCRTGFQADASHYDGYQPVCRECRKQARIERIQRRSAAA